MHFHETSILNCIINFEAIRCRNIDADGNAFCTIGNWVNKFKLFEFSKLVKRLGNFEQPNHDVVVDLGCMLFARINFLVFLVLAFLFVKIAKIFAI